MTVIVPSCGLIQKVVFISEEIEFIIFLLPGYLEQLEPSFRKNNVVH